MPQVADIYYHLYEGSAEGRRPAIVLIHGAGGMHLYWPPELRRLPGYRVYAIDLPGHGKSAGRGQQTIPRYVNIMLDWLGAVGLHRAVFIGHSMGAAIAISLALDSPEHVLGLCLVGAGARLRVTPSLLESTSNQATFYSAIETIVGWSFSDQAPKKLTELAAKRMAEIRPSVLHGDFLACNVFDEMEQINQIYQPTLVVCGVDDKMTPVRYSQFLVDRIPNAILIKVPGAGHMIMLEKPQAVARALADFLVNVSY